LEREPRIVALSLEVETAEAALSDAARAREAALKRTPLAREVRELDAAVRDARSVLAIRTLQLESERLFAALEDEATEIAETPSDVRDSDLAVLVAEFGALDAALERSATQLSRGEALPDDALDALVSDFAELKARLGLADDGGSANLSLGMLLEKCARSAREAGSKVSEGASFLLRGFRLLGEDVRGSAALFGRTLGGSTLKPREVQALRRTSRDVLTFVPFVAVLIAPITPVGHVLVFSFLQRTGWLPSQFTSRRQENYSKLEELRRLCSKAEEEAEAQGEETALRRAQEAVSALSRTDSRDASDDQALLELQRRAGAMRERMLSDTGE
jgi:hypothetical protein